MSKPHAKLLLEAAAHAQLTMKVYYAGETPDYVGQDAKKAWEAASACDEMQVSFYRAHGDCIGWALVVPGLDDDETVADYSGEWVDRTLKEMGRSNR